MKTTWKDRATIEADADAAAEAASNSVSVPAEGLRPASGRVKAVTPWQEVTSPYSLHAGFGVARDASWCSGKTVDALKIIASPAEFWRGVHVIE